MKAEIVLRIGLVHGGRILDERLVRAGDVTVGTDPGCTLVLPASARAPRRRQVVSWSPGKPPRLLGHGLTGRLAAGTRQLDLPTGAAGTPLTAAHRGKLVVGDSVILFQGLPAGEVAPLRAAPARALRLGRLRSRLDWPLFQALVVSAVVLGGSGGGLAAWWHETGRYYDDVLHSERQSEQLAVAEITARIERERPTPPPESSSPTEPTDAPTAADLPIAPTPAPVAVEHPTPRRVKRPARTAARRVAKRAPTADSVYEKTFLGALGRPDAAGTVAGLTRSAHVAAAFEDTDGGVTVAAKGDADIAGPRPSAPPQRDRYVEVCADGACGGAPLKTRQVAVEQKGDDDEKKPVIKVRDGSCDLPVGVGTADSKAIERVFARRKGAIASCYERYLQRHAPLDGVIKIRFTLGTAGRITNVTTLANSFGDPTLSRCITDKVQGWRFPPAKGGSVTFAYPFVLEAH